MADTDAWAAFGRAPADAPTSTVAPPPPASDAPQTVPDTPWAAFGRAPNPDTQGEQQTTAQLPSETPARELGVGTRDVLQGLTEIPGMALNALTWPGRALLRAGGVPVTAPSDLVQSAIDATGLPKAETPGEKLRSSIIQPAASSLTTIVPGSVAANAASPIVRTIGETLAAQPATQAVSAGVGGGVTEETGSPVAGAAAGLLTPFALATPGRLISPALPVTVPAERAPMAATAAQEGIPLSVAQKTGNKVWSNLESTLANLPGSSSMQASVNRAQSDAYNAALLRRADINATSATPETLLQGRSDLGQVFDDLSARNTLQRDDVMQSQMDDLRAKIGRDVPESQRGPVLNRLDDINSALGDDGSMAGQTYREMYTSLGQKIRSTTDGDARNYLGQMRDILRGAMDRSISPEDQAAWQDVRQKYANLQTIAKAMDRPSAGTAMGDISPAGLAQASRNPNAKSFAFGQGDLDDLARLGQGVLKQTVPDSGTSQRTVMANLIQGKSFAPALGLTALTGNPLYMLGPAAEVAGPYAAGALYHSGYLTNRLAAGLTPHPLDPRLLASVQAQIAANRLAPGQQQ
jgi:hypothetical protein